MKAIQQELDRLDEAFLYSESIDLTSYSRQRDTLREALTLAKIDHQAEAVDELDVLPEAIAFDGNRFDRTAATAPLPSYLAPDQSAEEKLVSRIFTSWNQLDGWLRQIEGLRRAA